MSLDADIGIFSAFYQWGRVQEDFYSKSLVYILKRLGRTKTGSTLATKFLNYLLCGDEMLNNNNWEIRDHTGNVEKPDIEIESPDELIFIEVKVNSSVDFDQLRRYRNKLTRQVKNSKKKPVLCLLTSFGREKDGNLPDLQVSWVKVWEQLGKIERELSTQNRVGKSGLQEQSLVREFRQFLKENGMGVERVPRKLNTEELDVLRKYLSIIHSGCMKAGLSRSWDLGFWWEGAAEDKAIGWWFRKGRKQKQYWCGFYLENPDQVSFGITSDAKKRLLARIRRDSHIKRKLKEKFPDCWFGGEKDNWVDFSQPLSKTFPDSSAEEQVTVISDFVRDVLETTRESTKSRTRLSSENEG